MPLELFEMLSGPGQDKNMRDGLMVSLIRICVMFGITTQASGLLLIDKGITLSNSMPSVQLADLLLGSLCDC